ncbi:lysylphosphatidylglycerol synthase transmembrane domain-containing protein [Pseudomonas nitroreducens]|uniref:lysylphosphatidylglycerol synthase transmembrane domain-containing protein n=1 Tax=Pseudomonas nitroreducens TaxID=46680 RepID=UPI002D7F9C6D|nr:lysylphosphatidylglycerol synthase transmembrane domain-containing protein [Pseudomonas nitroreducens]
MSSGETATPRRRWAKHVVGVGVTLICLIVLLRQINVQEIGEALRSFQWVFLLPGLAFLASGYAFRILRWVLILRAGGTSIGFKGCASPFLGSIALNNVLPLRLGDVVRALVFPEAMGIARTTATSSLVVERLMDLVTLLICFAVGLLAIRTVAIPVFIMDTAISLTVMGGGCLVVALLLSPLLARQLALHAAKVDSPKIRRVLTLLAELAGGVQMMSRPSMMLRVVLVSFLVWVGESGLYYFVLQGLGMTASPIAAMLVMSLATLSTLAPSSPGYIGPFHLAAYTAVSLVGGDSAIAGSYAVLVHLALWVPTTFVGAIVIWLSPQLFRMARQEA